MHKMNKSLQIDLTKLIVKSYERKSNSWDCIRDGASPAESTPYMNLSEVHPGADSVRDNLAESGNSRYRIRCMSNVICYLS